MALEHFSWGPSIDLLQDSRNGALWLEHWVLQQSQCSKIRIAQHQERRRANLSWNKGEKSECAKFSKKIQEKRVFFQQFVTSIVASKSSSLSTTQSASQELNRSASQLVSKLVSRKVSKSVSKSATSQSVSRPSSWSCVKVNQNTMTESFLCNKGIRQGYGLTR